MKYNFWFLYPFQVGWSNTPIYLRRVGNIGASNAPDKDLFRKVYFVEVIMYSLAPARAESKSGD